MLPTSILGTSLRHRSGLDSLRNQAYQRIKEKIISGAMPPASLIDENALAAELKLGFTPIRQALRWLALENLVIILPRRGTMVADVNANDLQKIYEVRLDLVPHAFRLAAARATPAQIRGIASLLEDSREIIATGNEADLLSLDRKVQASVIEASQNEFLVEILERLHSQATRFWRRDRINLTVVRKEARQLRRIVPLLKARNAKLAGKLISGTIAEFHREQMAVILDDVTAVGGRKAAR